MTFSSIGPQMSHSFKGVGAALLAIAVVAACSPSQPEPVASLIEEEISVPHFEMTLKPTLGADGEVDAIEVTSILEGGLAEGEERLMPKVSRIADQPDPHEWFEA